MCRTSFFLWINSCNRYSDDPHLKKLASFPNIYRRAPEVPLYYSDSVRDWTRAAAEFLMIRNLRGKHVKSEGIKLVCPLLDGAMCLEIYSNLIGNSQYRGWFGEWCVLTFLEKNYSVEYLFQGVNFRFTHCEVKAVYSLSPNSIAERFLCI